MHAVCFDMDGTLTDPTLGITNCIRYALERLGREVPSADELTWCIGPPLLQSFEAMLRNAAEAERALVLYRERFGDVGLFENEVYPGIVELLEACRLEGLRLFVATSKPAVYAERIIEHFGLSHLFEAVCGAELDGTRSDKTELLRWVVAEQGFAACDAAMVGDRRHDIIGARNNGIRAIGVTYGYGSREELEEAGADEVVDSPDGVASVLS